MKDDLEGLIKLWHPEVPEPSAFKREVWRRVEQRGTADSWVERFFAELTQPRIASIAAALALSAVRPSARQSPGQVDKLHIFIPSIPMPKSS